MTEVANETAVFFRSTEVDRILDIGAALSLERDLDRLLDRILTQCRQIVVADAGSIFLAEGSNPHQPTHLRFKLAQNDSIPVDFREFLMQIDSQSLAGYVASTKKSLRLDDVYKISPQYPCRFNPEVDQKTGYRSKSLLSIAMMDHHEELIGVIQLWNKKKDSSVKITAENAQEKAISFSKWDHKLLSSIASQAGVAIENAQLYRDIERLFEGFIRASVSAIEARDPTTRGHSERVATLTLALAEAVNRVIHGPHSGTSFSAQDLRELHYAALLHDFGKIGVREAVLTKAKKLLPHELEIIYERFETLLRSLELEVTQKKLSHVLQGGKEHDAEWKSLEVELADRQKKLKHAFHLITTSNEPTVLPENVSQDLESLLGLRVPRANGQGTPVLSKEQVSRLAVRKGSLSEEERQQIESHVSHTYEYLRRIPWTRELRQIPDIAHAHHEKLDGTGYPRRIEGQNIPLSSKIMAITDIFDALAARDRPYKKAVPVAKALEILQMEAQQGKLDPDLVNLFIESKVYEKVFDQP